jgi:hypothetical protein
MPALPSGADVGSLAATGWTGEIPTIWMRGWVGAIQEIGDSLHTRIEPYVDDGGAARYIGFAEEFLRMATLLVSLSRVISSAQRQIIRFIASVLIDSASNPEKRISIRAQAPGVTSQPAPTRLQV